MGAGIDPVARALALRGATTAQGATTLARLALSSPIGAAIGDSITAPDAGGSGGGLIHKAANGYMAWALALSDQRVRVPVPSNVRSYPGQETGLVLSELPAFIASLARKPGFCVIECGTNNISHNVATGTVASITADWQAIAEYLYARQIRVIFVPILPRGTGFSALFSPAQFETLDRCNRWLHDFAGRSGGWVAVASECLADMTDPAAVGSRPRSNMMTDGTHPGVLGAYYIGKAIAAILRRWYAAIDVLPTSNLRWTPDTPRANLLSNGMMATGTGFGAGSITSQGTGTFTGTIADAWTADLSSSAASGITVAASLVTSPLSGARMQQLTFGGTYTLSGRGTYTYNEIARLITTGSGSIKDTLVAGDTIEAMVAFEIDAGNNAICIPSLHMRWDGAANYNSDMLAAPRELPTETIRGVLRTPPKVFTGTPTQAPSMILTTYLKSFPDGVYNPAATIRYGRAAIFRVEE